MAKSKAATKLPQDTTESLAQIVQREIDENVFLCYQCVKCTSGCPLAEHFDLAPNQVLRAAQLGMEDLIYGSKTAWLCASCQTCTTRCPQGIDIAKVMDFIVGEAIKNGIESPIPDVELFNKVFLRDINLMGRSFELGVMGELMLRTRDFFSDIDLAVEMLKRRKLKFIPEIRRKRRRKVTMAPASRPPSEIGYYPGCSLHSIGEEFNTSTLAILEELIFSQLYLMDGFAVVQPLLTELIIKLLPNFPFKVLCFMRKRVLVS